MTQDMTYRSRYLQILAILLLAWLTGGSAMAQVTVRGSVYGGGNEADVKTNATVNITATDCEVLGSVYGGGNLGSVGTYDVIETAKPTTCTSGTGTCTVTISGGTIGPATLAMPAFTGHVFGASKGEAKDPATDANIDFKTFVNTTVVTISGGLIKGSVYGGSENGHVLTNTNVTISGGQIGLGAGKAAAYTEEQWTNETASDFTECPHWAYESPFASYDKFAGTENYDSKNGSVTATDGHTFYGNVFGGGSGYFPYAAGKWLPEAGAVYGNTNITISGGHVLTSIYGGNELTNVTGTCTVNMSGGTLGVPRTIADIDAHPVTCYLFGAGKGDPRTFFNQQTNVGNVVVNITGGRIFGSVFGGGEDGHVLGNVTMTIGQAEGKTTKIGTTGTSYVDGNVFGGGRGFAGDALTAGVVCGNVTMTISNGQILGSIYGGGRLGSVGTFLAKPDDSDHYGLMIPDNKKQVISSTGVVSLSDDGENENTTHGHITINISGGTIGNTYEYKYASSSETATGGILSKTEFHSTTGKLIHTKGGNVFTGSMGRDKKLDGTAMADNWWPLLGKAKSTTLNVSGTAWIQSSVYGGGELGAVEENVRVNISGGTIGTQVPAGSGENQPTYYFGSVYGGGAKANTNTANWDATKNNNAGGWAEGKTSATNTTIVRLTGGTVGDAFGGALGYPETKYQAKVYGDILVDLNGTTTSATAGEPISTTATGCKVNRIFGCNNAYGTPMGNVTVNVWATQSKDVAKTTIAQKFVHEEFSDVVATLYNHLADTILIAQRLGATVPTSITGLTNESPKADITAAIASLKTTLSNNYTEDQINAIRYDVPAVYGGGNEAAYTPADGKVPHVNIHSCLLTSIEYVYGGGNAAASPATNVDVYGAHEIYNVFGGGNGKDNKSDGSANPGADVGVLNGEDYGTGNTTTYLRGGQIHEAYGASNTLGNIRGTVLIDTSSGGECTLNLGKMVGAGKNADIDGNVNLVLECKPATKIPEIYGGADNANVNGSVNITVTSGNYGKVFGGNNLGGIIKGSITLNIEETGNCETPITIDELYLGGNQAAYSVYGYYKDSNDKWQPRTSASDINPPVKVHETDPDFSEENPFIPYTDPVLNVISCTSIGKVFGGGYGTRAIMYGNPTVNINMVPGSKAAVALGNADKVGTIGDVFGGGNEAKVVGDTKINIGTETKVEMNTAPTHLGAEGTAYQYNSTTKKFENITVSGANITGNVYGGGKLADVTGNTQVNICAKETGSGTNKTWTSVPEGAQKVTIAGNVYGGGMGIDDSFFCAKGMVGEDGKGVNEDFSDNTNYLNGNTRVTIGNGTVGTLNDGKLVDGTGNVYGGGEIGRVEKNTTVTIGIGLGDDNKTSAPNIRGDVFGGGKGKKTHGYAALVRGNPTVTIQADAKVGHNVYGAGEIASVARYRVPKDEDEVSAAHAAGYPDAELGMPYALASTTTHRSGYCTVIVQGNAEIGPNGMKMVHPEITDGTDKPDDAGHVFAAGKGFLPEGDWGYDQNDKETMPRRMVLYDPKEFTESNKKIWEYVSETDHDNVWEYFSSRDKYIKFIQTQGLASNTDVTIDGNAFVKGSVYGGSENGLVQFDAKVYIKGGQIGAGDGVDVRYTDAQWLAGNPDELKECASWEYKAPYAPYDPYAKHYNSTDKKYYYDAAYEKYAETGAVIATDGHTYYGNVFGGGSGSVPYFDADEGRSKYLNSAGTVKGNTTVEISGGHILTNVYGGCESTNVLGKATVKMTGGTLGVPRTDQQITDHPVTCYLFGAGKGDQRIFFNKDTNVNDAEVEVDGGRIYGSVYGGGEDGHVMRHSKVTIKESASSKPTIIGTRGTSYYDGNVFGGGRGFGGDALTAGNVGGSVEVNIEGGEMRGSIYGGGRMASVGYGLYLTTDTGYGEMRSDTEWDNDQKPITTGSAKDFFEAHPFEEQTFTSKGRGYITVKVSGGTIGNDEDDAEYGGHVFGGCMGSITKQDGSANSQWDKFATAKKTTVNVSNGTIKRSVFGGGEMGTVTTDAIVTVSGGTIGTEDKGGAEFGNVYGGGKGYFDRSNPESTTYVLAGIVKGNTSVTIQNGTSTTPEILHNVYGGGAYGSVGTIRLDNATYVPERSSAVANMPTAWERKTKAEDSEEYTGTDTGTATVTVTGGTIGTDGKENGMIFGSSRGDVAAPTKVHDHMAWVYNTHVTIGTSGGNTSTPTIKGSVYGSGENGHVFQNTIVDIHSGTIGINNNQTVTYKDKLGNVTYTGKDYNYPYRGNVYGGGCGTDKYHSSGTETYLGDGDTFNALAGIVLGTTTVNIDGGLVVHNVYGAGAMGSVGTMSTANNDDITITDGGTTTIDISGGTVGVDGTENGNVFGAARGDAVSTQIGVALVKTTGVTISSSADIKGNVYGGGEAGDVGTYHTVTEEGDTKGDINYLGGSGVCNVTMTGGEVHGHVFGAGKGEANTFTCQKAMADMTNVNISAGTVGGNVYGGGEVGRVEHNAIVAIGVPDENEGDSAPVITGSVFGAGAGVETHGYSALVRGNTTVTIQGNAQVGESVYGGGMIASVGKYGLDNFQMPSILKSGGICTVTITDYAKIGTSGTAHHVFGAGRGDVPHWVYDTDNKDNWSRRMMRYNSTLHKDGEGEKGTKWDPYDTSETTPTYVWEYFPTEDDYSTYLETLALATAPTVTINEHASVYGDVYGGGERGITKGGVIVNINGGTIARDVYGGGALANTNISNWTKYEGATNSDPSYWSWTDSENKTAKYTTTVNLHGGTIGHNVYGGGLGQKYKAAVAAQPAVEGHGEVGDDDYVAAQPAIAAQPEMPAVAALVYGDVLVKLNEKPTVTGGVASFPDNCIVKGVIHGANNYNGSPLGDVTVHIYKTISYDSQNTKSDERDNSTYDMKAVYGGGNEAAYDTEGYYPFTDAINTNRKAHVIIEGCSDTSIETVYGGGNAAAAPGTHVEVNSCYEIGTVFAGGNGKDDMDDGTANPGADVGYKPNPAGTGKVSYGTGEALAEIHGGIIHQSFGGSNTKGNVRVSATVELSEWSYDDPRYCSLGIDEAYGAGNEAEQDGTSNIDLGCLSYLREIYGGAKNADVNNDIVLTIQSGRFHRVFGGNNIGGRINGTITVNIEETGCHPIIIGQLFGGGNQAGYSVYGYKEVNGKWVPRESASDGAGPATALPDPQVNVKSFTSIGEVYGGGYGNSAVIVGNPTVNINVGLGVHASEDVSENTGKWIRIKAGKKTVKNENNEDVEVDEFNTVWQPEHKSGAIGTIGNVFGGGNAAPVHGNTNVNIGTTSSEFVAVKGISAGTPLGSGSYSDLYTRSGAGTTASPYVYTAASGTAVAGTTYYRPCTVIGADITGNVYGGGNAADVSGDTNVVIGKEKTTTTTTP